MTVTSRSNRPPLLELEKSEFERRIGLTDVIVTTKTLKTWLIFSVCRVEVFVEKNRCILICEKLLSSCCFRRVLAALWAAVLSKAVVNSSNPVARISLHWSPANKGREMESFRSVTPKKFNAKGRFMVCSEHFNLTRIASRCCSTWKGMSEGWNQDPFPLFGENLKYPSISRSRIGVVVRYA